MFFCFIPVKHDSQFYAVIGNPRISSAMVMAMSIFRILCVLVRRDLPTFSAFVLVEKAVAFSMYADSIYISYLLR